MRPRPGPDGTGRPDTPVSAAAVLEVAAGLRELDPRLSAELARHAVRLAGTDGELRGAAERVAARSLVEGRRGVEVVERAVPTLRAAVRRGARADELGARCDLAVAALRCRASALAAALLAPVDPDELPVALRAVATLRVAQVRAAEGDVEATDRAVARAREDHGGGTADPLVEIDLDRSRGEARRRRGDAAACAAVLGELRGRVPDTSDLDGGRRAAALVADHVSALVDAGALDEARAQAASWRRAPSTPVTCLGLGRLRVVVAGRLHLPAAPEEAESVAWTAERDLADGAHHREAADAARVVAEAAELRGRWPEALAALRRSRAHDARAGEEERTVDRLLAGVLGYAEGLAPARGGAAPPDGDEAAHPDAPVGGRPSAPATSVSELATPLAPLEPEPGTTVPQEAADDAVRGTAPRRRRRRAPDDAPPADGTPAEPGVAATTSAGGGVGGRRRRREPDEEPVESREPAPEEPGRPRHGRSDATGASTDRTAHAAGDPDRAVGAGEEGPRQDPGTDSPSGDAFSTAPERSASPDVDGAVDGAAPGAPRPPRHPLAGRDAGADVTAGPTRDPAVDHEDPLGIGWLLARSSAERTPPGSTSPGSTPPDATSPAATSPVPTVVERPGDGPTARTRGAVTRGARAVSDLGPAAGEPRAAGGTASPADADELPLTLVGLLAEYDLPDVGRPDAPRPDGATGTDAPRQAPGPVVSAPRERGRDGHGVADAGTGGSAGDDSGARLADLLADAMDAFRRTAPETGSTAGRGGPGGRSRG